MRLELSGLAFIFTGIKSKRRGQIPKQIVYPKKINLDSQTITCTVLTNNGGRYTHAFSFKRFEVFSHDDPAAILYNKPNTIGA